FSSLLWIVLSSIKTQFASMFFCHVLRWYTGGFFLVLSTAPFEKTTNLLFLFLINILIKTSRFSILIMNSLSFNNRSLVISSIFNLIMLHLILILESSSLEL